MTSTNDGKDVKSNHTSGPKGKTYYIELYKFLEARLSEGGDASERTKHLCEAWRRVHSLCQHSAPSTHAHLVSWLQRHTARTVLQAEWRSPERKDDRSSLEEAINSFIAESKGALAARHGSPISWETQLVARGEWFKKNLDQPWGHPVLTLLLNPNGTPPTDDEVLTWLKEERGVTFVVRLHTLCDERLYDIAMALAVAVMERVRATLPTADDAVDTNKDNPASKNAEPTFGDRLKEEAGFTVDVWDLLTDIEFVLLHKRDSKRCIALAKQTPLAGAYHLIERLQKRLEMLPREKKLWKNAKEVAILIAQVVIARCMIVPICTGVARTALYCCTRLLAQLLPATRLPPAADALANQALTARHLHTLASAVDKQLSLNTTNMKPYVCELYVRAITAGMNELERLKLKTEKEAEARLMERTLASWFVQLGAVLSQSDRILCECTLTAFSLHPSLKMYERLDAAPQPAPVAADSDESKEETTKSEFGSWANDSRSQTNFVKTSETLNMKQTQNQANVLSTAIFNEGEALGLSPELCQDIAVLLSGPRVKTLSWDMDRKLLLDNCRTYMESTHGGTRVLTRELKYLNIDPDLYRHLPEDRDDDENDPYYGIERGYEHLVPPEEIWEDAYDDPEKTESGSSYIDEEYLAPRRKKKNKRIPVILDEDSNPLSFMAEDKRVQKKKERPDSKERSKERVKKKPEVENVPVDPLYIEDENQTQKKDKPKKERKKKESTPKPKPKKSLASLVGLKVVKRKRQPVKAATTVKSPVITDSDYDSQGKNSLHSLNSEGYDPEVHFDGLFSTDEIKSQQLSSSHDSTRVKNDEIRIVSDKFGMKSKPSQSLEQITSSATKIAHRLPSPNVIHQQPLNHNRKNNPPSFRSPSNCVRTSLSKLLDFRRKKAVMDQKLQQNAKTPQRKPAIIRPDIPIQTNVSPKAVSIPEIPKSYINKQQTEKLAEMKKEVNHIIAHSQSNDTLIQRQNEINYLLAQKKSASMNSLYTAIPSPVIQYAKKIADYKETYNAFQPPRAQQQSNANPIKMTDIVDVPYDRLMAEIAERQDSRVKYDVVKPPLSHHQSAKPVPIHRTLNTMSAGQRDYQNFLKEYEQAKYCSDRALDMTKTQTKNIRPVSRVAPVLLNNKNEIKSQCAKPPQQNKPDNTLNTFSRLSYMHKNKQNEIKNKQQPEKPLFSSTYQEVSSELDEIVKQHQREQMKVIQEKKQREILAQNSSAAIQSTSGRKASHHNLLSNLLNCSISNVSQYHIDSQHKNKVIQQIPVSPPKSSLSQKDQNNLLQLLRQQNKLNMPIRHTIDSNSKPSTSNFTNVKPDSTSPANNYNSTSCQKQQKVNNQTSHGKNCRTSLEDKIINIVSNSLLRPAHSVNADLNININSEVTITAKPKLPISATTNTKTTDQQEKVNKCATNKTHAQNIPVYVPESEKPEWQAVMNDILKHKTPTRGPNALDVALKKSSFELAFERSLQEPSIFSPRLTSEVYCESTKNERKRDSVNLVKAVQNVVISSNKGVKTKNEAKKKHKSTEQPKKSLNIKSQVSLNDKLMKQNAHVTTKKLAQDVERKQFTYTRPKHDDPFISGIPNSDYDLLEELMDDDLRKEIGELSSDDESYNAAAQSFLKPSKSNEKRVSVEFNKPLTDMIAKKPATNVRCLNAGIPNEISQRSASKCASKREITSMNHRVANNDKTQENACLNTSNSLSTSAHYQATLNEQSQTFNNVESLIENQVINSNIYISPVTQQAPLQNVVLIGPELVYERYTTVQAPVHGVANISPSASVDVSSAPNLALYQTTRFTAPIVSPLIIGSSFTVPVINNTIPVQPVIKTVPQLPQLLYTTTTVEPRTEVPCSQISLPTSDINAEVSKPETMIGYQSHNSQSLDLNKINERKVLSEVQELAVSEKLDKTRSAKIESDANIKKDAGIEKERLKNKRLAIINREIYHRCGNKPIPLTYAPLPVKLQTILDKHNFCEVFPLINVSQSHEKGKLKSFDCGEENVLTQIQHNMHDLSNANNEPSPATLDSTESKENTSIQAVTCRRILLRSSNKITPKSNVEADVSESSSTNSSECVTIVKKSKVKLKSVNPESPGKGLCDQNNTVAKEELQNKKRASKRLRNKTLKTIIASKETDKPLTKSIEKNSSKNHPKIKPKPYVLEKLKPKTKEDSGIENSFEALHKVIKNMEMFDVEDELLGSKITKTVSVNKNKEEQYFKESTDHGVDKYICTNEKNADTTLKVSKTQDKEFVLDESTDAVSVYYVLEDNIDERLNEKIKTTINDIDNNASKDITSSSSDMITDLNTQVIDKHLNEELNGIKMHADKKEIKVTPHAMNFIPSATVTVPELLNKVGTVGTPTAIYDKPLSIITQANTIEQPAEDNRVESTLNKTLTTTIEKSTVQDESKLTEYVPVEITTQSTTTVYTPEVKTNLTTSLIGMEQPKFKGVLCEGTISPSNMRKSTEKDISEAPGGLINDHTTGKISDLEQIDLDMTVTCEDANLKTITFKNTESIKNITATKPEKVIETIYESIKDNDMPNPVSDEINTEPDLLEIESNESKGNKIEPLQRLPCENMSEALIAANPTNSKENKIEMIEERLKDKQIQHDLIESNRQMLCDVNSETSNKTDSMVSKDMDNDVVMIDDGSNQTTDVPVKSPDVSMQKQIDSNKSTTNLNDLSEIPQSYKDSLIIKHLPSDNPLYKSVLVTLPNGRKCKATVYGEVNVTFDTLFACPSIKEALMRKITSKKLYMNVNQITTVDKSDRSKILSAQIQDVKEKIASAEPVETIDLLSDDENNCPAPIAEIEVQAFQTQYGKYKVAPIDKDIFIKHQVKFNQKSSISLEKLTSNMYNKIPNNDPKVHINDCILPAIPNKYLVGLFNDIENTFISETKKSSIVPDIVEIDDSSNDSIQHDKPMEKPTDVIDELKNELLKELGVGVTAPTTRGILQESTENLCGETKIKNGKDKHRQNVKSIQPTNLSVKSDIFYNITNEEQSKIVNRKCQVKLIPCDKIVNIYEEKHEDMIDISHHDPITITEDISILNDLDKNIIESDVRSSSPVIELADVLISLDNSSLSSPESTLKRTDSSICEAEWLTTKVTIKAIVNNVFLSCILRENYQTSDRDIVTFSTSQNPKLPSQANSSAPSLMSLVLKYLHDTEFKHEYTPDCDAIIPYAPVISLKRKSTSLITYIPTKTLKVDGEIWESKVNSYSSELDSFDNSDVLASVEDSVTGTDHEISLDKSIDTTIRINKVSENMSGDTEPFCSSKNVLSNLDENDVCASIEDTVTGSDLEISICDKSIDTIISINEVSEGINRDTEPLCSSNSVALPNLGETDVFASTDDSVTGSDLEISLCDKFIDTIVNVNEVSEGINGYTKPLYSSKCVALSNLGEISDYIEQDVLYSGDRESHTCKKADAMYVPSDEHNIEAANPISGIVTKDLENYKDCVSSLTSEILDTFKVIAMKTLPHNNIEQKVSKIDTEKSKSYKNCIASRTSENIDNIQVSNIKAIENSPTWQTVYKKCSVQVVDTQDDNVNVEHFPSLASEVNVSEMNTIYDNTDVKIIRTGNEKEPEFETTAIKNNAIDKNLRYVNVIDKTMQTENEASDVNITDIVTQEFSSLFVKIDANKGCAIHNCFDVNINSRNGQKDSVKSDFRIGDSSDINILEDTKSTQVLTIDKPYCNKSLHILGEINNCLVGNVTDENVLVEQEDNNTDIKILQEEDTHKDNEIDNNSASKTVDKNTEIESHVECSCDVEVTDIETQAKRKLPRITATIVAAGEIENSRDANTIDKNIQIYCKSSEVDMNIEILRDRGSAQMPEIAHTSKINVIVKNPDVQVTDNNMIKEGDDTDIDLKNLEETQTTVTLGRSRVGESGNNLTLKSGRKYMQICNKATLTYTTDIQVFEDSVSSQMSVSKDASEVSVTVDALQMDAVENDIDINASSKRMKLENITTKITSNDIENLEDSESSQTPLTAGVPIVDKIYDNICIYVTSNIMQKDTLHNENVKCTKPGQIPLSLDAFEANEIENNLDILPIEKNMQSENITQKVDIGFETNETSSQKTVTIDASQLTYRQSLDSNIDVKSFSKNMKIGNIAHEASNMECNQTSVFVDVHMEEEIDNGLYVNVNDDTMRTVNTMGIDIHESKKSSQILQSMNASKANTFDNKLDILVIDTNMQTENEAPEVDITDIEAREDRTTYQKTITKNVYQASAFDNGIDIHVVPKNPNIEIIALEASSMDIKNLDNESSETHVTKDIHKLHDIDNSFCVNITHNNVQIGNTMSIEMMGLSKVNEIDNGLDIDKNMQTGNKVPEVDITDIETHCNSSSSQNSIAVNVPRVSAFDNSIGIITDSKNVEIENITAEFSIDTDNHEDKKSSLTPLTLHLCNLDKIDNNPDNDVINENTLIGNKVPELDLIDIGKEEKGTPCQLTVASDVSDTDPIDNFLDMSVMNKNVHVNNVPPAMKHMVFEEINRNHKNNVSPQIPVTESVNVGVISFSSVKLDSNSVADIESYEHRVSSQKCDSKEHSKTIVDKHDIYEDVNPVNYSPNICMNSKYMDTRQMREENKTRGGGGCGEIKLSHNSATINTYETKLHENTGTNMMSEIVAKTIEHRSSKVLSQTHSNTSKTSLVNANNNDHGILVIDHIMETEFIGPSGNTNLFESQADGYSSHSSAIAEVPQANEFNNGCDRRGIIVDVDTEKLVSEMYTKDLGALEKGKPLHRTLVDRNMKTGQTVTETNTKNIDVDNVLSGKLEVLGTSKVHELVQTETKTNENHCDSDSSHTSEIIDISQISAIDADICCNSKNVETENMLSENDTRDFHEDNLSSRKSLTIDTSINNQNAETRNIVSEIDTTHTQLLEDNILGQILEITGASDVKANDYSTGTHSVNQHVKVGQGETEIVETRYVEDHKNNALPGGDVETRNMVSESDTTNKQLLEDTILGQTSEITRTSDVKANDDSTGTHFVNQNFKVRQEETVIVETRYVGDHKNNALPGGDVETRNMVSERETTNTQLLRDKILGQTSEITCTSEVKTNNDGTGNHADNQNFEVRQVETEIEVETRYVDDHKNNALPGSDVKTINMVSEIETTNTQLLEDNISGRNSEITCTSDIKANDDGTGNHSVHQNFKVGQLETEIEVETRYVGDHKNNESSGGDKLDIDESNKSPSSSHTLEITRILSEANNKKAKFSSVLFQKSDANNVSECYKNNSVDPQIISHVKDIEITLHKNKKICIEPVDCINDILEKADVYHKQKDAGNQNYVASSTRPVGNTFIEKNMTSKMCRISPTIDSECNTKDNYYSIEARLAHIVGEPFMDVGAEKHSHLKDFAVDKLEPNVENAGRTSAIIKTSLDDEYLVECIVESEEKCTEKIQDCSKVKELLPEKCSTDADHENTTSLSTISISNRMIEKFDVKYEPAYVSTQNWIFLPEDEPGDNSIEEIIEINSDDIVENIYLDGSSTRTDNEAKCCNLTMQSVKVSLDDNSSSETMDHDHKTEHFEGDRTQHFYEKDIEMSNNYTSFDRTADKLDYDRKNICDLTSRRNEDRSSDNHGESGGFIEYKTSAKCKTKCHSVDSKVEATLTTIAVSEEIILNEQDDEEQEQEYEDPEHKAFYNISLVDNEEALTSPVAPDCDVNNFRKKSPDLKYIDRTYVSSLIIETNETVPQNIDALEARLAEIVGEPIMHIDNKNIIQCNNSSYKNLSSLNKENRLSACKLQLNEKYETIYSVEVEAITEVETHFEDNGHQLGALDDESYTESSEKLALDASVGMECSNELQQYKKVLVRNTELDTDNFIVIVPMLTYSRVTQPISEPRKNLKRKMDMLDIKTHEKKYRKGKNIDYPKITATSISETAYAKEYKRLFEYCSSVKFSYAIPFHKDHIDVYNTLTSWPIESSNATMSDVLMDTEDTLFTDLENPKVISDPLEQTLSQEILSEYDENSYEPSNIDETNFNMGFGERSGRVIQEWKDGEYRTFSAATLSDVKQIQPRLPSDKQAMLFNRQTVIKTIDNDQKLKVKRFIEHLGLREKVKSFFARTLVDLKYDLKDKKDDFFATDDISSWPLGLTSPRFVQPAPVDIIANVVQVGQLPVSAPAQNPLTCDPRVTHVSNVSPSQCTLESNSGDDIQTTMKTEYTQLTTAEITLPLMQEYAQQRHSMPTESHESTDLYGSEENATQIKSVVKIEFVEDTTEENTEDNENYDSNGLQELSNHNVENGVQYQFDNIASNMAAESETNAQAVPSFSEKTVAPFFEEKQHKDKSDQIANAMNAAGILATQGIGKVNNTDNLVNKTLHYTQSDTITTSQATTNIYTKSTPINAIALQQALSQILPPGLTTSENSQNTSTHPPVLHIVQGNNAQSVINKPNGTQLLHIVQSKNATSTNGTPVSQPNNFGGLSLVDGAIQQNGNQLLHIVNSGSQKNTAGQLLKRVNLLTNLTNIQGSNEQKMVQFVCKSADGKSIQLPHQRSMVLRLQPIDPSNAPSTPKQNEAQDHTSSPNNNQLVNGKEPIPQEMKSRSSYEENYAKFVQDGDPKPDLEKSTSLPKFNQVFGKQIYQESQNELDNENLPANSECPSEDNNVALEQISDIVSSPMIVRKSQSQPQASPNIVHQIKQTIGPMNIQTMHGGVIYTRQIPVNIGNGQTINLITVPSTELVEESSQKQAKNQEGDPQIIKIVPTSKSATPSNGSKEDKNTQLGSTLEGNPHPNPQPQSQPVLTQMRIKLPMLSKAPQVVGGTRVVRPSFFQIQRNVIGGANQQVYQQLVLTAAPPLGQSIRLPTQTQKPKTATETTSQESQMSSSTLEQLREFDMVLEQVKERSTVQPGTSTSSNNFSKLTTTDTTDASTPSTSTQESSKPVLYTVGNTQPLNMVNYVNRKSTITSTSTSSFVRSPDSTGIIESPSSSTHSNLSHTVTSASCASSCATEAAAVTVQPRPKKKKLKPSTSNSNPFNIKNTPKPSSQKPLEDEQTTQRILYILAEYKEQVENSPDKDKPAPRRRNNPAAPNVGFSKRKKSSCGSRRRDMSPVQGEDSCRTMGSEDSSCGTSLGECNECLESHSPDESPQKVVRRLTFEQETITQTRSIPQRNVIVADGQAFAVRNPTGKPATTVLMPANYLLPVSMVKGGQQIAIVTNRGPKLLVGAGEGGTGGTLLFQRLIGPGLKPVLTRPGVRHIRLPTAALHNLQTFNIATSATTVHAPDSTASPAPAPNPPDLVDTRAMSSPWPDRDSCEGKPEGGNSSPEGSEPWNLPTSSIADDYGYEEIVRTDNMDRTVLDAIPDRYSPDMEAQRIFDKMFDVESKKSMYDSRCGYDIDASDDDKAYHQVVQRKDGRHTRLTHVSAAALRHKYAILEHELRLQKSLSEECEDLGVDSPSASELFPEAELFFAPSPAYEQTIEQCHTPQPTVLSQGIPEPDLDDQIATDHLLTHEEHHESMDINLDDVGEMVTVGEDGMTTIPLDHEEFARSHEEFARSHPNTTFHSEPEDSEIPPFTIAQGIKGRQITFHARGVPGTVVMAPQTTVISQATVEATGSQNTVKFTDIDNIINAMPSTHQPQTINIPSVLVKDSSEGLTKFDRLLNESRELHLSNTASAIVHSTGNSTQVIRRVHYETKARYLTDDTNGEPKSNDRHTQAMSGDTSPERHPDLFWDSNTARHERRRFDFNSENEKCCKSTYNQNASDLSVVGAHTRLDSVIKAARTERRRSDGSSAEDNHPPLRTYPPKRPHQHSHHAEVDRSLTGKTRASDRCHEGKDESRRRASNRGVVKRGCHCCNGSTAPPKPKKSRPKKTSEFPN